MVIVFNSGCICTPTIYLCPCKFSASHHRWFLACMGKHHHYSPVNLDQKWGQPPTNCNRIFFACRWFSGPSSITYQKSTKIHQGERGKFLIKNAKEIYRLLSHRHNGKTNHKLPNSTSTVYFFKNMTKSIDILQVIQVTLAERLCRI